MMTNPVEDHLPQRGRNADTIGATGLAALLAACGSLMCQRHMLDRITAT
jgi:hypothetical protein